MPIYRNRSGKKITKLYADEIRLLHSTKDLLADLTLNQPLVVAYIRALDLITKVCDLWPIPESKKKKPKQESEPAKDALEDAHEAIAESAYGQPGTGELPEAQQGQPSPNPYSNDPVEARPEGTREPMEASSEMEASFHEKTEPRIESPAAIAARMEARHRREVISEARPEGLAEKLVEGARLIQQQEAASTEANGDF